MGQNFTETLHTDGNDKQLTSIGQTPQEGPNSGKEEFIGLGVNYERDSQTGLYYPPGYLSDDRVMEPRVRSSQLENRIGEVQDTPTVNTMQDRLKRVETELQNIQNDGVPLNGSNLALSKNPKTGTKTVTSTAAEIFADTSRLSDRSMMYIRNTHDSIAIRIGASNITDVKGRRILPNSEEKIEFDPNSDIPIYAISEFGDVEVEVFEA